MRQRSLHATAVAVIVAVLPALFVSTSLERTIAGDATATQAYLRLDLVETSAGASALPTAIAAIEALRVRLQSECPGVLAGEPTPAAGAEPSSSAVAIAGEIEAAVFGAAERTELRLRRDFADGVSRLAWSDGALTRLVRARAAGELARARIPVPDLCADIRAWVASGYQSVSPATEAYVRRESTLFGETEGAEKTIMRELARHGDESAADKRIARQISQLESHAVKTVVPQILAATRKIAETLHGPAS